jgi:hypothetical protein
MDLGKHRPSVTDLFRSFDHQGDPHTLSILTPWRRSVRAVTDMRFGFGFWLG